MWLYPKPGVLDTATLAYKAIQSHTHEYSWVLTVVHITFLKKNSNLQWNYLGLWSWFRFRVRVRVRIRVRVRVYLSDFIWDKIVTQICNWKKCKKNTMHLKVHWLRYRARFHKRVIAMTVLNAGNFVWMAKWVTFCDICFHYTLDFSKSIWISLTLLTLMLKALSNNDISH